MSKREVIKIFGCLRLEVMVSSKDSNNTCCVFVETTPPGAGPPPHKHEREEEIFTVLQGRYELLENGTWIPMECGLSILSPRNTFHAFRNVGNEPGRIMLVTNNGGIDDYFRSISHLSLPDDGGKLNEISAHYGYIYQSPA